MYSISNGRTCGKEARRRRGQGRRSQGHGRKVSRRPPKHSQVENEPRRGAESVRRSDGAGKRLSRCLAPDSPGLLRRPDVDAGRRRQRSRSLRSRTSPAARISKNRHVLEHVEGEIINNRLLFQVATLPPASFEHLRKGTRVARSGESPLGNSPQKQYPVEYKMELYLKIARLYSSKRRNATASSPTDRSSIRTSRSPRSTALYSTRVGRATAFAHADVFGADYSRAAVCRIRRR